MKRTSNGGADEYDGDAQSTVEKTEVEYITDVFAESTSSQQAFNFSVIFLTNAIWFVALLAVLNR